MEIGKIQGFEMNDYGHKVGAQPSFTGGRINPVKVMDQTLPHGKLLKRLTKWSKLQGEFGGILITALGTGLVAPIFIGFNPFVKPKKDATPEEKQEVKNTKLYTAMRQPISAGLAVLLQLSVLKPIDKFLDMLVNKKENAKHFSSHIDQTALNTSSYLKKLAKDELAEKGIKKPSWFSGFKRGFGEVKKKRAQFDRVIKARRDVLAEEQISKLAKSFKDDGEILINGARKAGDTVLDNKTVAELINKQIDVYKGDAAQLRLDVLEKANRAKVLVENEDYLREIFKDIPYIECHATPLRETERLNEYYKKTETVLKDLLAKETKPEVKQLLQEILDKPFDLRTSKVRRTLDRIGLIREACDGKYDYEVYKAKLKQRNDMLDRIIKDLESCKFADTAKATKDEIKEAIKKVAGKCTFGEDDKLLKEILHDTDTFGSNGDKLLSKIYKDVTKQYKKLIGNKYTSFNQIFKVIIGVFVTIPITCSALNWLYPRLMETLFPKLSGAKKNADAKKNGDAKADTPKEPEQKSKHIGLKAAGATVAAVAIDGIATKGKFTHSKNIVTKAFSNVLGLFSRIKPMKSLANAFQKDLAKNVALVTMGSIVVKDGIGCYKYVTQSMHNEKIPEEKRKFVASLDLTNGILMILAQIGMFALMNKYSGKLFNKLFNASFRPRSKANMLNRIRMYEAKSGQKVISRKLTLDKQFEEYKKTGFDIFKFVLDTAAATIVGKRIIVPLIATPLASKVEKYMGKKIGSGEETKPEVAQSETSKDEEVTNLLERYKKYYGPIQMDK